MQNLFGNLRTPHTLLLCRFQLETVEIAYRHPTKKTDFEQQKFFKLYDPFATTCPNYAFCRCCVVIVVVVVVVERRTTVINFYRVQPRRKIPFRFTSCRRRVLPPLSAGNGAKRTKRDG